MKGLLVLTLVFLFSCELHKQETKTQEQRVRAEVNLGVLSTLAKGVEENDLGLVEKTLNSGKFELNVPDSDGELLIIRAILKKRFAITKLLIEFGADPVVEDEEGHSAKSLIEGTSEESEWLSLFDGSVLSTEFANNLLFNTLGETNQTNDTVKLPLIKTYLELGAEINGQNRRKFTPLMIASSNGAIVVVKYLCSLDDVDPNVVVLTRRRQEITALSLATQAGHRAIKDTLIACGAVK